MDRRTDSWTDKLMDKWVGGTEKPWSEGAKPHCDEGRSRYGAALQNLVTRSSSVSASETQCVSGSASH